MDQLSKLVPGTVKKRIDDKKVKRADEAEAEKNARIRREWEKRERYVQRRRDTIRNHFETRYRLQFERFVGAGSHGGTGVFRSTVPQRRLRRVTPPRRVTREGPASSASTPTQQGGQGAAQYDRYIVKFSLGDAGKVESDKQLVNEAKWLQHFNGAEHFIRAIDINHLVVEAADDMDARAAPAPAAFSTGNDDLDAEMRMDAMMEALEDALEEEEDAHKLLLKINDPEPTPIPSTIPAMVLEYLPNGDLDNLRNKFHDAYVLYGIRPPGRLLWGLALCSKISLSFSFHEPPTDFIEVVRMCIGMAYYPHLRPGEREKIVPNVKPAMVAHLSIKTPNMLLDMLQPTDDEHELTPLIKMIDFGRTIEYIEPNGYRSYQDGLGAYHNIKSIGSTLQTLACPSMLKDPRASWIPNSEPWEWWSKQELQFATTANRTFCLTTEIDDGFRTFVGRLMSVRAERHHPRARPTLQEALDMCLAACRKDPTTLEPPEDEDDVRDYISRVVFGSMPPLSAPEPPPQPEQAMFIP